jgi:hypothetical protein
LGNHFYIGEVKYKNEILPGEQPLIMDRALFEAVRKKSLAQWSHRTVVRSKSDHLLAGLLFDDAGHRMVPTHATKAGVRYRYYVSTPFLHGEAKTASAGSVARVPAADIEAVVVKLLKEHLAAKQDRSTTSNVLSDRGAVAQLVAGIVVYEDRLVVRLKSENADEPSDSPGRARPAHPSPKINGYVPRCDSSCTIAVRDGGVAHRHNNVVKAFPSDRTDQPFSICVLPWGTRRCRPVANGHGSKSADEDPAIGPVRSRMR